MSSIFSKKFEELLSDSSLIKSIQKKLPEDGSSENEQVAALQARITSLENNVLILLNTCKSIMETCTQLNKVCMIHRKSIEEIYDFLSNPDNFPGSLSEDEQQEEKSLTPEIIAQQKKILN